MLNQDFSAARRAKLTATKQALLERLIQGRSAETFDAPLIRRRNETTAPLSFAQHRLWFTEQFEPNSTLYNLSVAVRLVGRLDVAVLEQSLNEIIRRHESLRTTFVTVEHKAVQMINSAAPLKLRVEDLSQLSDAERQSEIARLVREEQKRPFDLANGPLLRMRLTHLNAGEHVAILTMHHIITDGWSINVFIKEMAALYTAFVEGRPAPLAELPVQYADFASWQREWLQDEVLEAQLSYWRQQLAGAPPVLELPTDKPRPAVQSFAGTTHPVFVDSDVAEGLRALCRQEGVTLFMMLLAAWQLLLHRYLGQDDIVVGTEVANRNRKETEGLIGFFVNQLVLRTNFSSDPTFRELLRRVKDVCLEAYAHQDLPFEKLVEALQPERSLSYSPLYQIVFALQDAPPPDLELPGLKLESLETENTKAKFDLALDLQDSEGNITGTLGYNIDLYEAETIERLAGHYQNLLAAIVAEPDVHISRLGFMSAVELKQLRDWSNHIVAEFPREACIHELIEAQVKQQPEAIAVKSGGEELSYRELNSRANQVAQELIGLGVKTETVVGIMMERSLEMMVSVLGVLKAGAAYLPLDPAYPVERLAYMIADAGVKVLLSQRRLGVELPGYLHYQGPVMWLDEGREWNGGEKPEVEVTPENLAYVIYTSGSTGQPKATLIPHRAVVSHSSAVKSRYRLQPKDRVLQFASLSFDVAVEEIFPTWVSGGCVVLRPHGLLDSHEGAWEFLAREEISLVNLPTAYWQELIAARNGGKQELKLRLAAIGGELGLTEQFARAQDVMGPQLELLNVYGPTETTVTNTAQKFEPGIKGKNSVPIGKPIPNTQMYVLDRQQRLVPVGVSGELYIGGDGLARGYLNRPGLTAEKFVPHPFSERAGARLYRTGDVGRWLSDGSIEFLGRVDEQVKLRGFRIELGEIEVALQQYPGLREAVVVVREAAPQQKQLVAYVVAHENESLTTAELREHLKGLLPEYMIPQAFVSLNEIPLTPNGKVDRRALPQPESEVERAAMAARTPVEEVLVGIWSEVLGVAVGVADDFFELGGHSLLATQVVSRARAAFGVELALRELFENPTIQELAAVVERTLAREENVAAPPLRRVERDAELPLSFAQQRLWFIDQLEPGSSVYNVPAAVSLSGDLNLNALEQTLTEVIRRHEVLRTSFQSVEGRPVQVIAEAGKIDLPVIDVSQLTDEAREARIKQLVQAEVEEPFDLSRGPLLRARLLRSNDREHVLLLTMHHIATDGWSLRVLVNEVAALYEAFLNGQPSPLTDLAVQYADFAVWQRAWLAGEQLEKQLAYWKEQLTGAPAMLELPTDRPRPAVQTFRGSTHSFAIRAETIKRLKELSRREDVTFFMTLLAAWKVLLARYTGQVDLLVGTPIAGRNFRETEDLIGFFVNTLVLRSDLSGNPAFRELLGRVREVCLSAYAHQDLPFEKLVEELQPERSRSHAPIFQVLFSLQNAPVDELSLPGLNLSVLQTEHATSKFDLSLVMAEEAGELKGALEYNSDLFEAATIERLTRHFENLLEAVVSNPEQQVLSLPLLSEFEREQLIRDRFNRDTCEPETLVHLFETQARRTPLATALVYEDERVTYEELNGRANQLANYLQGLGLGPELLVALYLDRSIEMVVAIMAVLKAGAAYLPLDLSSPAERRAFMLQDAGASVLLTQHRFLEDLSPSGSIKFVCLDTDQASIELQSPKNPVNDIRPENLAYVIYTSGSTGQPKGVQITHANVTGLLLATRDFYRFNERDVWTLFHSYAFDFSVWELFGPLFSGGCLVVVPYLISRSPSDFYQLLLREKVTVLNQTPSAFRQLMVVDEQHEHRDQLALRWVIFAGEALELQSLAGWFERHAERPQLVNMYGITETTVHVTVREVTQADVEQQAGSVIGRAFDDWQVYVLDSRMEPVPVGVAGEIYVGGAGLARGYLNRPELTAQKFVPHPFSDHGGERLYRSGDAARWLNDGGMEYLGRLDQQVKLRGFRIELGEIEAALGGHPAVREAVVVIQTVDHDKRLVAYVVAEERLDSSELRQYLKGMLPEYMVPQAFMQLERLPLTVNGKVDRRALPAVEIIREESETAVGQTPVEEVLAGIWSEVLGVAVGVEDDFFDLGGHSLLATQVMSRVREAFGVEVALRELFERPTVKELGQSIERELRQGAGVAAAPIERRERDGELPLSFAQQRLWFIDQLTPGRTVYNIPLSVRLSGELNVTALEQTLNEIIKRHEVLRTSFAVVDQQPVQVIAPDVSLTLTVQDLTSLPEPEREAETIRLADAEAHQPFDLSCGPLLRVKLLRLDETEHVVLMTMHHIITDGWSLGVLIREVAVLYRAFAQGEPLPLPELPVQYADFAMWQRERLQGEELERQLSYWREQLAGAPAILELPTDRPRPPLQTFSGAHETFTLSAETTHALHKLSRSKDVTLFMTLLAVWQVLLHRYSGQKDIVVGADVANRNRAETERLIGFFVNMLVLRTNLSGDPTFLELLKRVKEVCLGAYAHQDLPFEKLVEELQPERSLNHSPLFQVLFVLQNAPMGTLELPGLRLSMVERERDEAQFDLILDMQEEEGKLCGTLRYNTDLFEADTIKRMVGHFETLLAAVVADPLQQLSTLPLLTEVEAQQLAEWNNPAREYPRDTCIHQLFEAQVERNPAAVALIFEDRRLSYRELNCRANQLAHYLRSLGVGPEVCVGLCMERSVDLIVALVAILKAGGAYVPLDASYPLERLGFMIEDAQIGILITTEKMLDSLPAHWAQTICLDTDAGLIASMSEENLESEVSAENLAYVMYTSGSTGQPKGVSVVHRSVVRLVKQTNYIDVCESDVFLHAAPISFDASTFEVWGSLLNGARLVLLEQQRPTLDELARAISGNGVTVLWLTAGLFHLMVEEQGRALLPVRRMLAGGDVLAVEQVRKYLSEMGPGSRLINGYGPTENTTFTCCHTMERDSRWEGSVPIGKPISNSTVYILDQQQRPVPVG
ncbi:MAG TPA: amino acid adenylation domain-containing protein, partial [Pyrinomonadaceae bacterium]|nr:amino acid adenylation domain-containing protein [Pyrinomonadaceae bacterium]